MDSRDQTGIFILAKQAPECISESLIREQGQVASRSHCLCPMRPPLSQGHGMAIRTPMETVASTSSTSIMHQALLGMFHLVMQQGRKILTSCLRTPLQERAAFPLGKHCGEVRLCEKGCGRMPRLQRRMTVPRNILILLQEKVGKHLSCEQGGGRKGEEAGQDEARRRDKRACSSSPGHLPWDPPSCASEWAFCRI